MALATSPAGLDAGLLVLRSMSFACLLFVCWLVWLVWLVRWLVGWLCGGVVVCVCFLVRPSLLGWWTVTPSGGGGGGGGGGCCYLEKLGLGKMQRRG